MCDLLSAQITDLWRRPSFDGEDATRFIEEMEAESALLRALEEARKGRPVSLDDESLAQALRRFQGRLADQLTAEEEAEIAARERMAPVQEQAQSAMAGCRAALAGARIEKGEEGDIEDPRRGWLQRLKDACRRWTATRSDTSGDGQERSSSFRSADEGDGRSPNGPGDRNAAGPVLTAQQRDAVFTFIAFNRIPALDIGGPDQRGEFAAARMQAERYVDLYELLGTDFASGPATGESIELRTSPATVRRVFRELQGRAAVAGARSDSSEEIERLLVVEAACKDVLISLDLLEMDQRKY